MSRTIRKRPSGYFWGRNEYGKNVPYVMKKYDLRTTLEEEEGIGILPGDYRTLPGTPFDYYTPGEGQRSRGGLMMSARNTGRWDDEKCRNGEDNRKERRNYKRRERQQWQAEVDAEILADDAEDDFDPYYDWL